MISSQNLVDLSTIKAILKEGSRKIAPLWSLENFVAVNPYMGMAEMKFEDAMQFLKNSSDARATLPVEFYLQALNSGKMTIDDITLALQENQHGIWNDSEVFIKDLYNATEESQDQKVKTLTDVASEINGKVWRRFMVDRISFWASAYFDQNQAIWKTSEQNESLFRAWKREAEIDYSTEAMGLTGFRKLVKSLPNDHLEASAIALEKLQIPEEIQEHYLNALLMKVNGWAGFSARIDWDARLAGKESHAVEQFLAILLVWELCFSELLDYPELENAWRSARTEAHAIISSGKPDVMLEQQLILQKAFDIAAQRSIIQKINAQPSKKSNKKTTLAQAVFCIDVRSETFRRNLETVNEGVETLGFAGFFGFPIKYMPLGHDEGTDQCPALISTSHTVKESLANPEEEEEAIRRRTLIQKFTKIWKAFKSGAVSCFGFVSPLGLYFLPKLFMDLFGITRPVANPEEYGLSRHEVNTRGISLEAGPAGEINGIPQEDRVNMALSSLKAMSMTESFAPIVLIAGHGASTVNNPHATGLDCGACGGHSGEANAKVAAAILNDRKVREHLRTSGIDIPDTTLFIAGRHDTTTDEVTLFVSRNDLSDDKKEELQELEKSLKLAGELTRKERGARMSITGNSIDKQIIQRSRDWSQVRPEWGLAGCSSFIVAPRDRTSGLNFAGKAFMHSYNWKKDEGFKILEVIMTAPMVVTSWINLQYFASAVDNKRFGAGNKALHNVVGGFGVLEGFAGDLRVGLPWQSVHDGNQYQHEPNRLNVIIEAPVDAMSKILEKHESIRQLCDNEWIYLFAINDKGKVAYKYIGNLEWELVD